MKNIGLIVVTTLSLFFIGFISGPFVLKLTEQFLGKEIVALTIFDSLTSQFSLGLLLAFCSICASCLLWAYSRKHSGYAPHLVFGLGLLVSFVAVAIAIAYKLLYSRYALQFMRDDFNHIPITLRPIDYFSWGFRLPLFVNAVIIAILLWMPRQRHKQEDNNVPIQNN